jgi:hypothetical protein
MTERYQCPCCGFMTLPEPSPGSLEICHVCMWQDDMVGFNDPRAVVGPNAVSLEEARRNFQAFGACERYFIKSVRPPRPDEYRGGGGPPPSRMGRSPNAPPQ